MRLGALMEHRAILTVVKDTMDAVFAKDHSYMENEVVAQDERLSQLQQEEEEEPYPAAGSTT
eukprot:8907853-Prorocentrum_lima.AAC.1